MVAVSRGQAAQLAWLRAPTAQTAERLLRQLLGPTDEVFWVCLALGVAGLAGLTGRRGEVTCAGVALPLVVVPPAVLMLASQWSPLYVDRYVLYALSGAPLLVACGAERVAGAVGRLRAGGHHPYGRPHGDGQPPWDPPSQSPCVTLTGGFLVALSLLHQLPVLQKDREPGHRPDDLGAVSRAAARNLAPGEPVLFLPGSLRNVALTYPGAFRGVRDVALVAEAAGSGTLYGREAGPEEVRRRLARLDRVWVVADGKLLAGPQAPRDPVERAKATVLRQQFVGRREAVRGGVTVRLYVRPLSGLPAPPPPPPRPERW
jgi:mannosyltransferase